jgi:hypothetical protein
MKKLTRVLSAILALMLPGCMVLSVYPFYSTKDVIFEPALAGDWRDAKKGAESWKFERGEAVYRVTFSDGDKAHPMSGHLFKLRGQLFLDLITEGESECEVTPPPIASHLLLRVTLGGNALNMVPLDYGWLAELLEKKPKAQRHHVMPTNKATDERFFVLTADTRELQAFVIKHLKTDQAWGQAIQLSRGAAPTQNENASGK